MRASAGLRVKIWKALLKVVVEIMKLAPVPARAKQTPHSGEEIDTSIMRSQATWAAARNSDSVRWRRYKGIEGVMLESDGIASDWGRPFASFYFSRQRHHATLLKFSLALREDNMRCRVCEIQAYACIALDSL